jgi:hypothetical protein
MSTTQTRLETLAAELASGLLPDKVSVYPTPGAAGRGDVFLFVDAPTYVYESATQTFCPGGRTPRLDASLVVVGAGTAPGQETALLDVMDRVVELVDQLSGWMPNGDAVPGEFESVPAYVIPLRTL